MSPVQRFRRVLQQRTGSEQGRNRVDSNLVRFGNHAAEFSIGIAVKIDQFLFRGKLITLEIGVAGDIRSKGVGLVPDSADCNSRISVNDASESLMYDSMQRTNKLKL